MLRTEGRGLESRLCPGLSLAGSHWSDIIGITSASDTWSYGRQMRGCGLEKAYHSMGSLDPTGAARDEVYAMDLSSMGGVIEEIGV